MFVKSTQGIGRYHGHTREETKIDFAIPSKRVLFAPLINLNKITTMYLDEINIVSVNCEIYIYIYSIPLLTCQHKVGLACGHASSSPIFLS